MFLRSRCCSTSWNNAVCGKPICCPYSARGASPPRCSTESGNSARPISAGWRSSSTSLPKCFCKERSATNGRHRFRGSALPVLASQNAPISEHQVILPRRQRLLRPGPIELARDPRGQFDIRRQLAAALLTSTTSISPLGCGMRACTCVNCPRLGATRTRAKPGAMESIPATVRNSSKFGLAPQAWQSERAGSAVSAHVVSPFFSIAATARACPDSGRPVPLRAERRWYRRGNRSRPAPGGVGNHLLEDRAALRRRHEVRQQRQRIGMLRPGPVRRLVGEQPARRIPIALAPPTPSAWTPCARSHLRHAARCPPISPVRAPIVGQRQLQIEDRRRAVVVSRRFAARPTRHPIGEIPERHVLQRAALLSESRRSS